MSNAPLHLGVIGLGRAFTLMLPTFATHPLIKLVAASDPREDARARFAADFGANVYEQAEDLCRDPSVHAIYIASPHQFHVEHVTLAAKHRKHVLVEKPMALTIADCQRMIAAAKAASIHLMVGHSHSYDRPYLRTRELIQSGAYGRVRMINALNFTDFLYRPRRPEELDTRAGGGVVFSQGAHQVDILRLLSSSPARAVRAFAGKWDDARPTEGAYNAQIAFEDGAFASITYSGYGRFDTDEFAGWRGELGQMRDAAGYGAARKLLKTVKSAEEEAALKNKRAYGPASSQMFKAGSGLGNNHFGLIVVSCEKADLRPQPHEIVIYGDEHRQIETLPMPDVPRAEVVQELYDAVVHNKQPLHSGEWGMATLEICLAILASAQDGREVSLHHQI